MVERTIRAISVHAWNLHHLSWQGRHIPSGHPHARQVSTLTDDDENHMHEGSFFKSKNSIKPTPRESVPCSRF
jgi:hypothetical protein